MKKQGKLTAQQMDSLLTIIKKCDDLRQLKKVMKYAATRIDLVKLAKTSSRKFRPTKRIPLPYAPPGNAGGYAFGGPVI